MAQVTDPAYISKNMLDAVMREKFYNNTNDAAVRDQADKLMRLFRESKSHPQVIADVLHTATISKNTSPDAVAEIGFAMGLQFGFELAMTCPPDPDLKGINRKVSWGSTPTLAPHSDTAAIVGSKHRTLSACIIR